MSKHIWKYFSNNQRFNAKDFTWVTNVGFFPNDVYESGSCYNKLVAFDIISYELYRSNMTTTVVPIDFTKTNFCINEACTQSFYVNQFTTWNSGGLSVYTCDQNISKSNYYDDCSARQFFIDNFRYQFLSTNEQIMTALDNGRLVTAAIHASDLTFRVYKSGVLTSTQCSSTAPVDTPIVIVGYRKYDTGGGFWIIS